MTESQDKEKKAKKTNVKLIGAVALAAVVVVAGGLVALSSAGGLLNNGGDAGSSNQQITDLTPTQNGSASQSAPSAQKSAQNEIKIPVSSITNKLSFYKYTSNGTTIRFFAVKGADNNVHVAFDRCDVCGPKGYTQSGNDVVCKNCGKHFSINSIGTANVQGGCWPSHLPMSINGDSVVIKTSDVVAKESKF
ncbi:MAG: Fe-S-containing protein [Halobacteriota archaeon]